MGLLLSREHIPSTCCESQYIDIRFKREIHIGVNTFVYVPQIVPGRAFIRVLVLSRFVVIFLGSPLCVDTPQHKRMCS